jgi:hypothetical protein
VVAQRFGFAEDEALTLGRAVAGLNAYSKGRRLGLFKHHEEKTKKARELEDDLRCADAGLAGVVRGGGQRSGTGESPGRARRGQ